MRKKSILSLVLAVMLLFTGCGDKKASGDEGTKDSTSENESNVVTTIDEADMFTDRDYDASYDENKSVLIKLSGDSASCDSDAVSISGTTVTILDEGTYILTGTLNDGMIIVNADEKDKPQIVLKNAAITSETSAALYILEADKVFVTLADGTKNTFANGGTFLQLMIIISMEQYFQSRI